MKFASLLFAILLGTGAAWSQPVPASQFAWPDSPTTIRLISVDAPASWRDGRPVVAREAVARILKISAEGCEVVDLIEELSRQGWVVQRDRDGAIVARPAPAAAAAPSGFLVVRETEESRRAVANFRSICDREHTPWVSDPRQALVDRVGQAIAAQARRPVPWTLAIVRSKTPNAACTGEGMVYITTALLDILNEDELAGVLGHEVAHGARQHLAEDRNEERRRDATVNDYDQRKAAYEREMASYRSQAMREIENGANPDMVRASLDSRMQSATDRFQFSMRTISERAQQHKNYDQFKGQTDERQADLAGIRLASAAGYRADGLLTALEKLQASDIQNYGQVKMLGGSTHPPIGERIKALREILSRWR